MLLQIPTTLLVCSHGLVVQLTDKMRVFNLMAIMTEIYHISDIREVQKSLYLLHVIPINAVYFTNMRMSYLGVFKGTCNTIF